MIRILLFIAAASMSALTSGCASAMLDGNELHDAHFSTKGIINVDFWRQADGSYIFSATGDVSRTDRDILDAWHKFVAQVGRGRSAEGEPTLSEFDYKQGYSMVEPYAMGQPRRAKRASGTVRFTGEMTKK